VLPPIWVAYEYEPTTVTLAVKGSFSTRLASAVSPL
jgi:hypothetical protein